MIFLCYVFMTKLLGWLYSWNVNVLYVANFFYLTDVSDINQPDNRWKLALQLDFLFLSHNVYNVDSPLTHGLLWLMSVREKQRQSPTVPISCVFCEYSFYGNIWSMCSLLCIIVWLLKSEEVDFTTPDGKDWTVISLDKSFKSGADI